MTNGGLSIFTGCFLCETMEPETWLNVLGANTQHFLSALANVNVRGWSKDPFSRLGARLLQVTGRGGESAGATEEHFQFQG